PAVEEAAQMAVDIAEDGNPELLVRIGPQGGLLARHVVALIQHVEKLRPGGEDSVVDRRRARQQAVAAFRGLLYAHEPRDRHVVVRVRSQLAGALVATVDGILGAGLRLGHPSQAVAAIALADRHTEVETEAPVDTLELLVAVALPREAGN